MKPQITTIASIFTLVGCFQEPAMAQSNFRADQSNQRARDRYNDYMRKQREQIETHDKQFELQRSLEAKLNEIPIRIESEGAVREFCLSNLQSAGLPPAGHAARPTATVSSSARRST